jgi:hypothetical protein
MQRYYTTVSRYVHGRSVFADPEHPAVVEFEDDIKVDPNDRTLIPIKETGQVAPPAPAEKLQPHYAKVQRGPAKMDPRKRPSDNDPE